MLPKVPRGSEAWAQLARQAFTPDPELMRRGFQGEVLAPGQMPPETTPDSNPGAADLVASSQLISSLQSPQTGKQQRVTEATAGIQPIQQQGPRTDEQLALDRRNAFLDAPSSMAGVNNVRALLAEEADARGGDTKQWAKDSKQGHLPKIKALEQYLGQQQLAPNAAPPAPATDNAGQNGALGAGIEAAAKAYAASGLPAPQLQSKVLDTARYDEYLQGPFAEKLRSNPANRNDRPAPDHQAIVKTSADGPDQNAMAAWAALGGNTAELFNPFSAQVHAAQLGQAPKSSILAKLPLLDPQVIQQANRRPDRIRVNGGYA